MVLFKHAETCKHEHSCWRICRREYCHRCWWPSNTVPCFHLCASSRAFNWKSNKPSDFLKLMFPSPNNCRILPGHLPGRNCSGRDIHSYEFFWCYWPKPPACLKTERKKKMIVWTKKKPLDSVILIPVVKLQPAVWHLSLVTPFFLFTLWWTQWAERRWWTACRKSGMTGCSRPGFPLLSSVVGGSAA